MNETSKTFMFVGVAAALLGLALMVRPTPMSLSATDDAGQQFFPEFKDPLQAKSLEMVEFDEDQATLKPFKVAQVRGVWSIPSHSNYPADAQNQLGIAASSLIDLKKLAFVSDKKGDQPVYGVVDPTSKDLTAASTGVGKKVTMEDADGKALAQFIIGKADAQRTGVRYVRIPGQERIYRTEMNIDKLSTNFGDWIEKDLLKLNAFDVKRLVINDYSVNEAQRTVDQRGVLTLEHDSQANKWSALELKERGKRGGWQDSPLKEDEELNASKLNDLKAALDDLKIIDVARKPEGLSRDLRSDMESLKAEDRVSLMAHGFFSAKIGTGPVELFSNEGEVRCGLSDGVEYVIRFGAIAGNEKSKAKEDDAKKESDAKDDDAGTSRYVMVTARFNSELLAPPKFQPLPEATPPATEKPAEAAKPADTTKPADPKPATPEPPKTDKPAAEKPAAPPAAETEKPKSESCEVADEKPAADKPVDDKPATEKPVAEKPATPQPIDTKPAAPPVAGPAQPTPPPTTDKPTTDKPADKPKTEAELAIERVEKENKRLQDEYDDKIKAGEKKVKELNDRFADWYYVISEATYKKIHLTREDIVQKKAPPADPAADAKKGAIPFPQP